MAWPDYEPASMHVKLKKDNDHIWPTQNAKYSDWTEWINGYLDQPSDATTAVNQVISNRNARPNNKAKPRQERLRDKNGRIT